MGNEDMVRRIDDSRLEPPEDPAPVIQCPLCGRYLYSGDKAYEVGGVTLCAGCMDEKYGYIVL